MSCSFCQIAIIRIIDSVKRSSSIMLNSPYQKGQTPIAVILHKMKKKKAAPFTPSEKCWDNQNSHEAFSINTCFREWLQHRNWKNILFRSSIMVKQNLNSFRGTFLVLERIDFCWVSVSLYPGCFRCSFLFVGVGSHWVDSLVTMTTKKTWEEGSTVTLRVSLTSLQGKHSHLNTI